jgi:flagellar biosynthesis anti-sigma factor FlgM
MINLFDYNPASGPAAAETGKALEIAKGGTSRAAAGRCGSEGGGDSVQLSQAAGSLQMALESASADRAGRIAALRAAYESGRYTADPAAISRGLVEEALSAGAMA